MTPTLQAAMRSLLFRVAPGFGVMVRVPLSVPFYGANYTK